MPGPLFLPEGHIGGTGGSTLALAEYLGKVMDQSPGLFSMNFPLKNKKACVPGGTQAVKARLGKEGGSLRGEGNRLCALAKGVPFPPSTKSLLQSLTRYRGARSGRLATRSASAGRKGRSRAWAGVTQRSS